MLVAGPNGAGKSTYTKYIENQVPVVDPDRPAVGSWNAVSSARAVLAEVRRRFERSESFAVETTLSGKLPRKWIAMARSRSYDITLYFIALARPEVAMARVRRRVASGGHDVPVNDIRRRFYRGIEELRVVAPLVDRLVIIDNSGQPGYKTVFSREAKQPPVVAEPAEYLASLIEELVTDGR